MSKLEITIPELQHINQKVDLIIEYMKNHSENPEHVIMDNEELMAFLKISKSKAAMLRNEGKIPYSKESPTGKVWYLKSEVLQFIQNLRHEKF